MTKALYKHQFPNFSKKHQPINEPNKPNCKYIFRFPKKL